MGLRLTSHSTSLFVFFAVVIRYFAKIRGIRMTTLRNKKLNKRELLPSQLFMFQRKGEAFPSSESWAHHLMDLGVGKTSMIPISHSPLLNFSSSLSVRAQLQVRQFSPLLQPHAFLILADADQLPPGLCLAKHCTLILLIFPHKSVYQGP